MNKRFRNVLISTAFALCAGIGLLFGGNSYSAAQADHVTPFPRNGTSGTVLFVNGAGQYFKKGEADLAICCWNNGGSAWSERVDYRVSGDLLRVMIPYKDGQSQTWSYFKVCRYNPTLDPRESGDYGVYNETESISFGNMQYGQNIVNITGYGEGKRINYMWGNTEYYGIKADNHMYLDLSGFTAWEEGNAKFAIYFAYPNSTNENRWSQSNSENGYYASFCWKVNGQDNDHLYECIVPNIYSGGFCLWNMAIAVRLDPAATQPNWDQKWNQTQDLKFNKDNEQANMIRITDWNDGYLDAENVISRNSRTDFYGRYFMNTVTCSGDGEKDATTADMWNAVKAEYKNHLSRTFQGDVWTIAGDEDTEARPLAQAMARYDYIVLFKQYEHEDFINRKDSPNKTEYAMYVPMMRTTNKDYTVVIISVILFSILSMTSVILVKVIKNKHEK